MDRGCAVSAFSAALVQLASAGELVGGELGEAIAAGLPEYRAALAWLVASDGGSPLVGYVVLPDSMSRMLRVHGSFSEADVAVRSRRGEGASVVEFRIPR